MATYKQIVYLALDELKNISDDGHFQEEHLIFLANAFRSFLLKQRYNDIKKEIPESNYQTICVDLERVNALDGEPCTGADYMRSVQKIPYMMTVGGQKVSSTDFFQGNFTYVNNERFKYVGNNKYLKNQIYSTIAPDSHLYIKSNNPQFYYLSKVKVTGIFEDTEAAAELECPDEEGNTICDIMDKKFPIEDSLVQSLVQLIVQELSGVKYQPEDKENNASDDLSNLHTYIRNEIAKGRYSDLYKALQ